MGRIDGNRITVQISRNLYTVTLANLPGCRTLVCSPQEAYDLFHALQAHASDLYCMAHSWQPCQECGGGHPKEMKRCPVLDWADQEGDDSNGLGTRT